MNPKILAMNECLHVDRHTMPALYATACRMVYISECTLSYMKFHIKIV